MTTRSQPTQRSFSKTRQIGNANKMSKPFGTLSQRQTTRRRGEPIAQKPATSGPAPMSAPYAPGTCSLDLNQTKTDNTDRTGEYLHELLITDNSGAQIGYTEPGAITPDHPLGLQSKLEELLEMSPVKGHHSSVNLALGQQMWDTTQNDVGRIPYCEKTPDRDRIEYKCKFICGWGRGRSSEGSN